MTRPVAVEAVPSLTAAPPPRRRHRATAAALALAVAAIVFTVVWSGDPFGSHPGSVTFQVWHQRDQVVLYERSVELDATFTLEHTHSVTRRLVRETFSVQEGPVVALEELWFDEPGPNLPSGPEPLGDGQTTFLRDGRAFRVLHHGYPIGAVPLLVGSDEVGHVVNFPDGEQVRLLDIASRGAPVELRVR